MKNISVEMFGDMTENDCIQIQILLSNRVQQVNTTICNGIKTIAGVDLAYWNDSVERAVCCIVVVDIQSKAILEKSYSTGIVSFPYIPGCLAFRELPLVVAARQKLRMPPDVFMFDGNGILHPRHMGLATHASFYLDRPTLGVAKSYYKIEGATFTPPKNEPGCFTDIVVNGAVCGRALRTRKDVRPVFVSVGNQMDIDTATSLTMSLIEDDSHIPIPTRYADLETHTMRNSLQKGSTL